MHMPPTHQRAVGTLTLSSDSVIDMGTGSSVLRFTDSHLATWPGNQNIVGGTDRLFFGDGSGSAVRSREAPATFS